MKSAGCNGLTSRPLAPLWDFPTVLAVVSCSQFEPLEQAELKLLSLRTAILIALALAKHVVEMHAPSVDQLCILFSPDNTKVSMRLNPAFIPKTLVMCYLIQLPILIRCLSPLRNSSGCIPYSMSSPICCRFMWPEPRVIDRVTSCLCPELNHMWGSHSHWIVGIIAMGCTSRVLQPSAGLQAHSTKGLATSWSLFKWVSIQEVQLQ